MVSAGEREELILWDNPGNSFFFEGEKRGRFSLIDDSFRLSPPAGEERGLQRGIGRERISVEVQ